MTASETKRLGYQPGLDGLRAISVIVILFYHAGFGWMGGGFFAAELFFVVSGYLITSLLIQEQRLSGRISLRNFWKRRIQRLLPALLFMMVSVGVWCAIWGTEFQRSQLRRDYPWAIFYSANWGQIFSEVEYFSGTPTLFRHMWSLGVEEQWYIVWPIVFILLSRLFKSTRKLTGWIFAASIGVMAFTATAVSLDWPQNFPNPFRWSIQDVDTHNFLYLSTWTRTSGLLFGAGLAFLWKPWQRDQSKQSKFDWPRWLGITGLVTIFLEFIFGEITADATYIWVLPSFTLASASLVLLATVEPRGITQRSLRSHWLTEVGKRSYSIYLWSWPISGMFRAYDGSYTKFLFATLVTIPFAEISYRFVELPIRRRSLPAIWRSGKRPRALITGLASSFLVACVSLAFVYSSADPNFEFGKDKRDDVNYTTPSTQVTRPPRNLVIVGDSVGRALYNNLPNGIEKVFKIGDGSLVGCSVYTDGEAMSSRNNYSHNFDMCSGWTTAWLYGVARAEASLALVVVGGWDVFDQRVDGQVVEFGSEQADARFMDGLQEGIDVLSSAGVHAAVLELPCMRPKDVDPAGVVALPERAMDDRVAHINALLRRVVEANSDAATFIEGPKEYCADESISSDSNYRWDGVHPYKLGANLTFQTITNALLEIPES